MGGGGGVTVCGSWRWRVRSSHCHEFSLLINISGGLLIKKNQRGIWRQWADLEEVLVCVGKGHVHTGVLVIGMALTVQPQSPVDTTGAGAAVFGVHRVVVRTPLLILWKLRKKFQ